MTPDPISPYAVAKYSSELYIKSFHRCYGLETVSLRYFNVFGPRQDPASPYSAVLAKFIALMLPGSHQPFREMASRAVTSRSSTMLCRPI